VLGFDICASALQVLSQGLRGVAQTLWHFFLASHNGF